MVARISAFFASSVAMSGAPCCSPWNHGRAPLTACRFGEGDRAGGRVSGISNQTVARPSTAMLASPRKATLLLKASLRYPANVGLSEAPTPLMVPTTPCDRLHLPAPPVRPATVQAAM